MNIQTGSIDWAASKRSWFNHHLRIGQVNLMMIKPSESILRSYVNNFFLSNYSQDFISDPLADRTACWPVCLVCHLLPTRNSLLCARTLSVEHSVQWTLCSMNTVQRTVMTIDFIRARTLPSGRIIYVHLLRVPQLTFEWRFRKKKNAHAFSTYAKDLWLNSLSDEPRKDHHSSRERRIDVCELQKKID